ncbi:uncharacterized protein LOC125657150 [Ostrea edulis]|uniref:uncharacterized protein LOC125657150 n=1 Tax=Ostrea edulis TaxID=37623 RepID=UPI0024AF394E|nr:uncharacterized protein LOC125657150 [Ostrea edulis]
MLNMRTSIFLLLYISSASCDVCFSDSNGKTFYCQSRCCDDHCCVKYDDYTNWKSDEIAGAVIGTLLGGTIFVLGFIYIIRNFCHKKRPVHQSGTDLIYTISNEVEIRNDTLPRLPPSYETSQTSMPGRKNYSRFENEA